MRDLPKRRTLSFPISKKVLKWANYKKPSAPIVSDTSLKTRPGLTSWWRPNS